MTLTEKGKRLLKDRYEKYCISITPDNNKPSGSSKMPPRNNFFTCEAHSVDQQQWTDKINGKCESCIKYSAAEKIDGGLLLTGKDVLSYLITLKAENSGKTINNEFECAYALFCHWVHCNVYPVPIQTIVNRLKTMHASYTNIKRYDKKKKTAAFWQKYSEFVTSQKTLFDIKGDADFVKEQEEFWGVKMTEEDNTFYDDQKGPRIQYCSRIVDPKWRASRDRRLRRMNRSRNESYDDSSFEGVSDIEGIIEEEAEEEYVELQTGDDEIDDEMNNDNEMSIDSEVEGHSDHPKKRKYQYDEIKEHEDDDLPNEYRHIRNGQRSVRPEVYYVAGILSSKYHMSHAQVEGAIITVANELFGRKKYGEWKTYDRDIPQDKNTMPAMSNTRRTEQYMEAMALGMVVEEIMNEGTNTTVVYSNDGSAQSGVGKYVVQSLNVNGIKRTLPTFAIFTESRESLSDLMMDTMKILSAATGYRFSEKDILQKISFVMTDSTSHNLKVIEKVCEEMEVENVPSTILCNVHPLMMFQSKVKLLCQQLHDTLGTEKINNCFMVDVEFRNESFVIKAITCLSNFINSEYSAKPWNRWSHFTEFIRPKDNMSISLKDHRFNRLMDCSLALLYHFEDIASYLDKFTSINNGITVLDRSFVDMDILKPIFAAISLLGVHITRPFHNLVICNETNYSTLLKSFPLLYKDLTEIKASEFLTVNQVTSFISPVMFKESLPKECLLEKLSSSIALYPSEIAKFLQIALKMFADGFSYQKGAIFGFGPTESDGTGTVLKISNLSKDEVKKMDENKVQVHNLGEERTVGSVNYELAIRGKSNLESASRKIVLNRCSDLLQKADPKKIKSYKKEAANIKEIKMIWNNKMKDLEKKGYSEKEILNTKKDESKLTDLEFLKAETPPGPFTRKDEVHKYITDNSIDDITKNKRLYIEIRYARNTSLSLKESEAVFRLKRNYKNLTSDEYAENLMQYLDDTRNVGSVSVDDLNMALLGLHNVSQTHENSSQASIIDNVHVGEHVAVVQIGEDGMYTWVLGIVDSLVTDNSSTVAHMISKDGGIKWTFPERAEIKEVLHEQIFCWNIAVSYCQTAKIRCSIEKQLAEKLDAEVLNFSRLAAGN